MSTAGTSADRPEVVVGRIGRAHGIKGEVSVEPRTDEPDRRFADGTVLVTRTPQGTEPHGPARPTTLTVHRSRWHQSRLLVTFEGVEDRTAAEALRGLSLVTEVDPAEVPEDPEEFYDHQLVGLTVVDRTGTVLGTVTEVWHPPASPVLAVDRPDGRAELVPFVSAIVPTVDLAGGRLVVDPPDGMFPTT
jgi:16S rRNA processing protein RimM